MTDLIMICSKLFRGLTGLAVVLACLLAHAETEWDPAGQWAGQLRHRGADLEVRIQLQRRDQQLEARLDIPSLVYRRQAMNVSLGDDGGLTLEFPFGIGLISVKEQSPEQMSGEQDGFSLQLTRSDTSVYEHRALRFSAMEPKLEGSLYLPEGAGPHPVAVLIAGSGSAARADWSYASWVDVYLEQGVGAFIYDRRPDMEPLPDGSVAGIENDALDVVDAIRRISRLPAVNAKRIGVAGGSRGAWIAMAVARHLPDLAFMILSSPAAATPGEQEMTSVLTGMRQDGLNADDLAEARSYLRLYFYVARSGEGWDLLTAAIQAGQGSDWLQYMDQPQALGDLRWWRQNMDFDAIGHLQTTRVPVLALWGGNDFITPWADYRLKLESALRTAAHPDFSTQVFSGADHRLEVGFGEDEDGQWHWFGLAPGVLETIRKFASRATQR